MLSLPACVHHEHALHKMANRSGYQLLNDERWHVYKTLRLYSMNFGVDFLEFCFAFFEAFCLKKSFFFLFSCFCLRFVFFIPFSVVFVFFYTFSFLFADDTHNYLSVFNLIEDDLNEFHVNVNSMNRIDGLGINGRLKNCSKIVDNGVL